MHRNTIFVEKPAATSAYTGPGDIIPGAVFWTGLRGYNAAYSTGANPAVDIVDQAGNNPVTINILADGTLDIATINAWVAAHSVTAILISKLYDQSGNGNHFVQATNADRPTLKLGSIGTNNRPSIQRPGNALINVLSVQTIAQAQPYFVSTVCRCDTANSAWADVLSDNGGGGYLQLGFSNNLDNVFIYVGATAPVAAAVHGAPHAIMFTLDNPGSTTELYVDGTGTSGNLTVNQGIMPAQTLAIPGSANAGENPSIGEIGMWAGTATPAQKSNMNTNQRTTWYGF